MTDGQLTTCGRTLQAGVEEERRLYHVVAAPAQGWPLRGGRWQGFYHLL